jgi:hypothetical protein
MEIPKARSVGRGIDYSLNVCLSQIDWEISCVFQVNLGNSLAHLP